MKKRHTIPDVPEPKKVYEKLHQNFLNWMEHLRAISPRIEIMIPTQDLVDTFEHRLRRKLAEGDNIQNVMLEGWPDLIDIAFILRYDSSLVGGEKNFLLENTVFFLYDGITVPLDRFTSSEYTFGVQWFSLADWEPDLRKWEFIEELIIRDLLEIQGKIRPLAFLGAKGPFDSIEHVRKGRS